MMKMKPTPYSMTWIKTGIAESKGGRMELNMNGAFDQMRIKNMELAIHEWQKACGMASDRIAELEAEIAKLRGVCADAYQLVGAVGGPVEALDNLSAAANGEPIPHDTFLPFRECDCLSELKELREAAAKFLRSEAYYNYILNNNIDHVVDIAQNRLGKERATLRALLSQK